MRKVEFFNYYGELTKRIDLCFPDDFTKEETSSALIFSSDMTSFTTPPVITENLKCLREAQRRNNQIEHGLIRIAFEGVNYVLAAGLAPLEGTDKGLSYKIYHREDYDTYTISPHLTPISIIDSFHSHSKGGSANPAIMNLFSPEDIMSMGNNDVQKSWLLELTGEASCSINPQPLILGDEFIAPADKYQQVLDQQATYAETLRAFLECIRECKMLYYRSPDLVNFYLQTS